MSKYVLLKSTNPTGAALYFDDELIATWDKHEPEGSVMAQVRMRAGDAEIVERQWNQGEWPYDLPNERNKKPKVVE